MNFTPELTALQGIMISADNVHSFSKLTAKGGNEAEIEEVILWIKNFLVKENYASDNTIQESSIPMIRKFTFYIILNADLKILESMVEKEGIDFLIWTIPTIPKCLMCELLWKLHMEKFVEEVIAFCSPELSIEIAESLINHMKYISPMDSADKLKVISASCYKLICRLNFFNVNESILNSALNIFQKSLKYFSSPPNVGKLESLRRNQLYKYIGDTLLKLLLLLYECFEEFNDTQKFQLSNDLNIYMLTYNEESIAIKDDFKIINSKKIILDSLQKCNEALLDILKELVMGVSLDIFCTWSEFEDNGKSMQQTIGEFCYKLRGMLMKIESVTDHPVIEMLQQISCKPVEIEDIINTVNSTDIIQNINNSHDKHLWVQALLTRNDLFHDLTLLKTIILNLNVLKVDDFYRLYLKCIEYIKNFTENKETVKQLALRTFQHCNVVTKQKIIDDTFTDNCFCDELKTIDFDVMMIEIFNKLIVGEDKDLSEILSVFIQSPKHVYQKIFILATENAQQSVIMGQIMKYLEKYSQHHYIHDIEPCLIKSLKEVVSSELDSEAKQNNFINLVKDMKVHKIISCATLLLLVLMPALHEALLHRKLTNIYFMIKILLEVFALSELLNYRAPMLAMIAQVLEVVRWKIHTFNSLGPPCLELAIKLQKLIMDTYKNHIPEKESSWLKSKLKNKNPLNMYYYRTLWNPSGDTYFEILTGIPVNEESEIDKLTFHVSQILPSTTLNEWYELWDSLSYLSNGAKLDIIHSSMLLISTAEKDNHTDITWACLVHCIRNFILVIRHKYIMEPMSDGQVVTIINMVAVTASFLEEGHIEELQSVILPLLAYIAERKKDYTLDLPACIESATKSTVLTCLVRKLFASEVVEMVSMATQ